MIAKKAFIPSMGAVENVQQAINMILFCNNVPESTHVVSTNTSSMVHASAYRDYRSSKTYAKDAQITKLMPPPTTPADVAKIILWLIAHVSWSHVVQTKSIHQNNKPVYAHSDTILSTEYVGNALTLSFIWAQLKVAHL